jgi:hypothetical protein
MWGVKYCINVVPVINVDDRQPQLHTEDSEIKFIEVQIAGDQSVLLLGELRCVWDQILTSAMEPHQEGKSAPRHPPEQVECIGQ